MTSMMSLWPKSPLLPALPHLQLKAITMTEVLVMTMRAMIMTAMVMAMIIMMTMIIPIPEESDCLLIQPMDM